MQDSESLIIVQSTFPDELCAEKISKELVNEKLAACAQIHSPVTSFYIWEESLQSTKEFPVSFKVSNAKHAEFRKLFLSLHPYDVPQYYWLDAQSSQEFGHWVNA